MNLLYTIENTTILIGFLLRYKLASPKLQSFCLIADCLAFLVPHLQHIMIEQL